MAHDSSVHGLYHDNQENQPGTRPNQSTLQCRIREIVWTLLDIKAKMFDSDITSWSGNSKMSPEDYIPCKWQFFGGLLEIKLLTYSAKDKQEFILQLPSVSDKDFDQESFFIHFHFCEFNAKMSTFPDLSIIAKGWSQYSVSCPE